MGSLVGGWVISSISMNQIKPQLSLPVPALPTPGPPLPLLLQPPGSSLVLFLAVHPPSKNMVEQKVLPREVRFMNTSLPPFACVGACSGDGDTTMSTLPPHPHPICHHIHAPLHHAFWFLVCKFPEGASVFRVLKIGRRLFRCFGTCDGCDCKI